MHHALSVMFMESLPSPSETGTKVSTDVSSGLPSPETGTKVPASAPTPPATPPTAPAQPSADTTET